jgi:hypothetical protein
MSLEVEDEFYIIHKIKKIYILIEIGEKDI